MKFQKPDGVIEYGASGCCCPPGERGFGMHTNCGTMWWRVDNGTWHKIRSQHEFMVYAQAAETCQEFIGAMLKILVAEANKLSH